MPLRLERTDDAPEAEESPIAPSRVDEPDPTNDGAAAFEDVNTSAMDRLRGRYEKLDDGVETFTVPTYGEMNPATGEMVWPFVGRYKRLDPKTLRQIRLDTAGEEDPSLGFNMEVLVQSCVELGVLGRDGEFDPLSTDPEHPMRWDERLAAGLGFEVDAPDVLVGRAVLQGAFKDNLSGINEHSADVYTWMLYGRAAILDEQEERSGKG